MHQAWQLETGQELCYNPHWHGVVRVRTVHLQAAQGATNAISVSQGRLEAKQSLLRVTHCDLQLYQVLLSQVTPNFGWQRVKAKPQLRANRRIDAWKQESTKHTSAPVRHRAHALCDACTAQDGPNCAKVEILPHAKREVELQRRGRWDSSDSVAEALELLVGSCTHVNVLHIWLETWREGALRRFRQVQLNLQGGEALQVGAGR